MSEVPVGRWNEGWDGHELEQRRRFAALTFEEKLRWLDEAQRLVRELDRARRAEPGSEQPGEGTK